MALLGEIWRCPPIRSPDSYSLRQGSGGFGAILDQLGRYGEIRHDLSTNGRFRQIRHDLLYLDWFGGISRFAKMDMIDEPWGNRTGFDRTWRQIWRDSARFSTTWRQSATFDRAWRNLRGYENICQDAGQLGNTWKDLARFDRARRQI